MEELNRVSAENKKLTEMLSVMCENYSELRNQLVEYTTKNPTTTSRLKRTINNGGGVDVGPAASTSSDEDSSKKPCREDLIKAKISQVHVRTEASDTSLVSPHELINSSTYIIK